MHKINVEESKSNEKIGKFYKEIIRANNNYILTRNEGIINILFADMELIK
jgi:hypothetical protein